MKKLEIPSCDQLKAGIDAFEKNERRGYVYFIALTHIQQNWGKFLEMANGIKILLDVWHRNFYRFGQFNLDLLSECIRKNIQLIEAFCSRSILSLSNQDEDEIYKLFTQFLNALKAGRSRSPVAGAKSLHLLAPEFFPLWDNYIANGYDTLWGNSFSGAYRYINFCWKIKDVVRQIADYDCICDPVPKRSILKLIDEYNYSKFTKHWI